MIAGKLLWHKRNTVLWHVQFSSSVDQKVARMMNTLWLAVLGHWLSQKLPGLFWQEVNNPEEIKLALIKSIAITASPRS